ncbi:MAG TPA: SDR family oxidoreductase [Kofleriaceae bacterium]|nr:SDR family oxidoreductase [Kofleriaceae bacterium]
MKNIVVIGATGLVGGGIAGVLSSVGNRVLALGRNQASLDALQTRFPNVRPLVADIGSDAGAQAAAAAAIAALGTIDVVITSVNPPRGQMKLRNTTAAQFSEFFNQTIISHFAAARAFLPVIAEAGAYIAVGGGSADFVWPNYGHISTAQAAQRMLLNVLAAEYTDLKIAVRNYMITAMVHDGSSKEGISAHQVGDNIRALLNDSEYGGKVVLRFPQ